MKFTYLVVTAAFFAASCQHSGSEPVKNVGAIPDSVLVPYEVATKYVNNYASHAGYVGGLVGNDSDSSATDEDSKINRKPDTRCIWFSRERLTEMLAQLDKENGDGIRFYLMTYNRYYSPTQRKQYKPLPPREHWGYNSLLVVSTKDSVVLKGKDSVHFHQDYYHSLNVGSGKGAGAGRSPGFIVGFTPENRGELCPPPSDCFSIGATLLNN